MQPVFACLLLISAFVAVAYGHGQWAAFALMGCESYADALNQTATEHGYHEKMKECKEMSEMENIRECFWGYVVEIIEKTEETPSESCYDNVKLFFKMP